MAKLTKPVDGSSLHRWLASLAITEIPATYQLLGGLAVYGALLRRQVWVDQVQWKVYPNVSVMFVGPTGIGKDVIIRCVVNAIEEVDPEMVVGGKTMEAIQQALLDRSIPGQPTCAVLPLPELTAFLGGKDYQKSMVQELTDIMSTGERINLNLRSVKGDRTLHKPTVTVLAGSTLEWLHRAMPEGALEGGFLPRFLIVNEDYTSRHIPLIKYALSLAERRAATAARTEFLDAVRRHVATVKGEITPSPEAADAYAWWYEKRFERYGPSVRGYANRARDQVLRVAMISAVSRGHNWMEADDIQFAVDVLDRVIESVELVAAPASREAQVADEILALLPTTTPVIYRRLGRRYTRQQITSAIQLLMDSGRIRFNRNSLQRIE